MDFVFWDLRLEVKAHKIVDRLLYEINLEIG